MISGPRPPSPFTRLKTVITSLILDIQGDPSTVYTISRPISKKLKSNLKHLSAISLHRVFELESFFEIGLETM